MRSSSSSSFIDNYHSSRHDLRNLNDLRNRCISSGLSQLSLLASHHLQCRHTTSHYTNSLALDPEDETLLLSGSSEGMLSVYDLIKLHKPSNTKVQVKTNPIKHMKVHEGLISTVQWFPMDKGVCISSSMDGTVNLYDASDFTVIETFQLRSPVYKAKFNTDGNMIATALLNGTIVLCDPNTGDSSHTLVGHDCAVMNLDWCPTEQHLLASSCKDGSVRIWDIRKGGRDSVVLCLDWHQDHTALTSGTGAASSNRNRIGSSNVNSFRKIDWKKVEASRAHDMAAISVKVIIVVTLR